MYEADILFYSHQIYYSDKKENLLYNPLVSTIDQQFLKLGLRTLTIARPFFSIDPQICFGNIVTLNGVEARIFYLKLFLRKFLSLFNYNGNIYDRLHVYFWKKVFIITKSKILIGIEPLKEVCEAAAECNVLTVDIMHGIQGFGEEDGSYFLKMSYRGLHQKGWPDLMGCWDLQSFIMLKKNRGDYTTPFILGHPAITTRSVNTNNKKRTLLFALQYKQRGSTDFHPIPQVLIDFIKVRKDLQLWIRIHPLLMKMSSKHKRDAYKSLSDLFVGCKNVDWEKPSNMSLLDTLNESKVHLTVGSSSTLEAIQLGVPCGIFDDIDRHGKPFRRYFTHELKSGDVTLLPMDSMSKLSSFVDSLEPNEPTVINKSKNYTSEFIDNVGSFLKNNNNCLLKVYNNH
ncbi:MAG: hypothetical protein CMF43_05980 [Legionellales bacterium]|nr:hypothetical protein [Legionellales bacterium]